MQAGAYVRFLPGSAAHAEGFRFGTLAGTSTLRAWCRQHEEQMRAVGIDSTMTAQTLRRGVEPEQLVLLVLPEAVEGMHPGAANLPFPVRPEDVEVIDRPWPTASAN